MRVLGIDPSSKQTGWAVVDGDDRVTDYVASGVIRLRSRDPLDWRLVAVLEAVGGLIDTYDPDAMAVETGFVGKYPRAAIVLAEVRSAASLAALTRQLPLFRYTPAEVKVSVTDNGNATKAQVAEALPLVICRIEGLVDMPDDETDALATAQCHVGRVHTRALVSGARFGA